MRNNLIMITMAGILVLGVLFYQSELRLKYGHLIKWTDKEFDCAAISDVSIKAECEKEHGIFIDSLNQYWRVKAYNKVLPLLNCIKCRPQLYEPPEELYRIKMISVLPVNPRLSNEFVQLECGRYSTRHILFGTNRKPLFDQDYVSGGRIIAFGKQRSGELVLGIAQTEIKAGSIKFKSDEAADCGTSKERLDPVEISQFDLSGAQLVSSSAFNGSLSNSDGDASSEAIIFVHGYNTSLQDAIIRGSQISESLGFRGHTFIFSWPSAASIWRYDYDRDSILASRDQLRWFLQLIEQNFGVKRLFIIAHSMGNQLVTEMLRDMESYLDATRVKYEYIMAAPDVDVDVFEDSFRAIARLWVGITQYVSGSDRALWASYLKSGQDRVGSFRGAVPNTYDGVDVIDITQRAQATFSWNHSAYADDPYVIFDLYSFVRTRTRPPGTRNKRLRSVMVNGRVFWRLEVEEKPDGAN